MLKRLTEWSVLLIILVCCAVTQSTAVNADYLQSANYKLDETSLGVSDLNQGASANYQAVDATGDLSVGSANSNGYQIQAGSKTSPDPTLSFVINGGGISFGSFSSTQPTVTSGTFSVLNYTSYGYVAQIIGSAPTNGNHTITTMATTDTSHVGTEQFGINLVANTLPSSVGANPDNGQFGFGLAATNYNSSNSYRYVSGETIASAPKSSGITNYTISYLVNVASITPGGQYAGNQTIIVTGTY